MIIRKDYWLVYFAYPLNMSTLAMAALFYVTETHKSYIFLIQQIWNRRKLHNKLSRGGRICMFTPDFKKKKHLNKLRCSFAKEGLRGKGT